MNCCPHTRRVLAGGFSAAVVLLAAAVALVQPPSTVTADEPKGKADPTTKAPAKPGKTDHPCYGGDFTHNMVNLTDKGLPEKLGEGEENKLNNKVLKWEAALGSRSYGGPVIANGKIIVGTNNGQPRNSRDKDKAGDPIDKGVVMCFDEKTGDFLWQAVNDKLPSGQVNDWQHEGVCSTPLVDGDRVYLTTNRCTLQCLDINGGLDGFQGKPLKFLDAATKKERVHNDKTDADVIWELDMMKDLGVFPHNMTAASPLLVGDVLYLVTANGVDENHENIPAPNAPSFIAVDKKTGKVLWQRSDPGRNIMHGQWSNPVYAEAGGTKMVVFPGGDGWLYAFSPEKGELIWKFDANPKDTTYELGGAGTRSDFVGTPVVVDGLLYIGTGQDPEHYSGIAHFYAIDLKKAVANAANNKDKDVSPELVDKVSKTDEGKTVYTGKPNPDSAVGWHYGGKDVRKFVNRRYVFGRTMSSACVVDGICYISELNGTVHALDAKTGKKFWAYDTNSQTWGSCYYADGRIYLGTEKGELWVFKHDKDAGKAPIDELDNPNAKTQKEFTAEYKAKRKQVEARYLLEKVDFHDPILSTPVVANGVLYVMTESALYAIKK